MIQVDILDDHPMVLQGIETMLEDHPKIRITRAFARKAHLMEALQEGLPDVLLLDINLADANGLELAKELIHLYPGLKIIGLSNFSEPGFIKNMLRNGAKGYLLKNTDKKELSKAILAVSDGETYLPRAIRDILLQDSIGQPARGGFIPKLTRREQEILDLIAREHTNAEIADGLCISPKTVESHRNNLLQKLGARNTAGLIRTAMEKGLLG